MFNDGSSTARTLDENYKIINYESGNAKERFEGKEDGKGTIYYKNGQRLIGNFKWKRQIEWGRINGFAMLVSANGDILRSGTFIGTKSGLYCVEEEVKILTGKISDDNFTAEGKLYFASNKIFIGTFKYSYRNLELVGEGQLIDANGEKIEEGICSLKRSKHVEDGVDSVEYQHGIYFGKETTGPVSGKIHLTNGKTYQGEFEIQEDYREEYFNPTEGTLFSYDGTVIQEGKWKYGKFVG
jgi:hypothetical protein